MIEIVGDEAVRDEIEIISRDSSTWWPAGNDLR